MRRPTLCSNVTAVEDCYSAVDIGSKEESRLSRVKRMLTGTLLTGRRGGSGGGRTFGQRLEELPLGRDGVPAVAVRLCSYIEQHGTLGSDKPFCSSQYFVNPHPIYLSTLFRFVNTVIKHGPYLEPVESCPQALTLSL